jgi:hypothetical protein
MLLLVWHYSCIMFYFCLVSMLLAPGSTAILYTPDIFYLLVHIKNILTTWSLLSLNVACKGSSQYSSSRVI